MSNYIPHKTITVITYACWNPMLLKRVVVVQTVGVLPLTGPASLDSKLPELAETRQKASNGPFYNMV